MPILATYDPNGSIKIQASAINQDLGNSFSKFIVEQKDPRFVYAIARAVTADVPNKNWDYFPLEEIKKSYQTFIGRNIFLDHNTSSVRNAVGKIIAAELREDEEGHTYVACLFKIDRQIHPDIAMKIENGIIDSVSMGANVSTASCNMTGCNCVATRESMFCEHLRNLGQYIDQYTGERNYSINRGLDFTELSLVSVPADPTAKMHKVFNEKTNIAKTAEDTQTGPGTQLNAAPTPAESPATPTQTASEDIKTQDDKRYVVDIPDVMKEGRPDANVPDQTATVIEPVNKETGFFQIDAASNEAADLLYNIMEAHTNKGVEDIGLIGKTIKILFAPWVKDPYKFVSDAVAVFGMAMGHGVILPEQITASYHKYITKQASKSLKLDPARSHFETSLLGPVDITVSTGGGSTRQFTLTSDKLKEYSKDEIALLKKYLQKVTGFDHIVVKPTYIKVDADLSDIVLDDGKSFMPDDLYEKMGAIVDRLPSDIQSLQSAGEAKEKDEADTAAAALSEEETKNITEQLKAVDFYGDDIFSLLEGEAAEVQKTAMVDAMKGIFKQFANGNKKHDQNVIDLIKKFVVPDSDDNGNTPRDREYGYTERRNAFSAFVDGMEEKEEAPASAPAEETAAVAENVVETVAPAVEEVQQENPEVADAVVNEVKKEVNEPVVEKAVEELAKGTPKEEVKEDLIELMDQKSEVDAQAVVEAAAKAGEAFKSVATEPVQPEPEKKPGFFQKIKQKVKEVMEGPDVDFEAEEPVKEEPVQPESEQGEASGEAASGAEPVNNQAYLQEIFAKVNAGTSLSDALTEFAKSHKDDRAAWKMLGYLTRAANFDKSILLQDQQAVNDLNHAGSDPRKKITARKEIADLFRNLKDAGIQPNSLELQTVLKGIFTEPAEQRFIYKFQTVYNNSYDTLEEQLKNVSDHRNEEPAQDASKPGVTPAQADAILAPFAEKIKAIRADNGGLLPQPAAIGKILGEFLRTVVPNQDKNAAQEFLSEKEQDLLNILVQPKPSDTQRYYETVKTNAIKTYSQSEEDLKRGPVQKEVESVPLSQVPEGATVTDENGTAQDGTTYNTNATGSFKTDNWSFTLRGVNNETLKPIQIYTKRYKKIKNPNKGEIKDHVTNTDEYEEVYVPKNVYRSDDTEKLYDMYRSAYRSGAFTSSEKPSFDVDFTYDAISTAPAYGGSAESPARYVMKFSRKANTDGYDYEVSGDAVQGLTGHGSSLFECLKQIFKSIYYEVNNSQGMSDSFKGKGDSHVVFKYQPIGIDREVLTNPEEPMEDVVRDIHLVVNNKEGTVDNVIAQYSIAKTMPQQSYESPFATKEASANYKLHITAEEEQRPSIDMTQPEDPAQKEQSEGQGEEQGETSGEAASGAGPDQKQDNVNRLDKPVYHFAIKAVPPFDAIVPDEQVTEKDQNSILEYLTNPNGFREFLLGWEINVRKGFNEYKKKKAAEEQNKKVNNVGENPTQDN